MKSAVLAQKARDEKVSGVIGQILNIPVTCHPKHFPSNKYEYGSYQQNKDASVVDGPRMDWFWDQYLPNAEPEVYASPLLAKDLGGLPPARKPHTSSPRLRRTDTLQLFKLQAWILSGMKVWLMLKLSKRLVCL